MKLRNTRFIKKITDEMLPGLLNSRFFKKITVGVLPFLINSRFIKRIEAIGLIFLVQLAVTLLIGGFFFHFFLELAEEVVEENPTLMRIDEHLLDHISDDFFPGLIGFMKVITDLGSWQYFSIISVLLSVYFYFKPGFRLYIFHVLLIAFGTMAFNRFLKGIYDRERPDGDYLVQAISSSYPSGHAMLSFAFYGLMIYFTWLSNWGRAAKIFLTTFFLLLIGLIGLSRVYFGVHYPSDVVAGYAAGAFWLSLSLVTASAAERIFWKNSSGNQTRNLPPEK